MYIVSQTFETLGSPCKTTHHTARQAEVYAQDLREEIAAQVSEMKTPDHFNHHRTGLTSELEAWDRALEIAGVKFDDDDNRTPHSPKVYGPAAGRHIAEQAVVIDEE